jgi:chromosome segregation ATPase
MKKEMVSKVNMVAGEFRKVSDLQMVETTKRTIRENVTISQQLSKMSEKTMALLRENEALRRKETEMSRRVELLEASHREVTRKNVSNQKVILLLQEKAREQERELEELRYTGTQCVKLERQTQQAMEQAATTTIDSKVYRERSQNVEAELASMQAQLSDARRQIQSLTVILTQSAHTIQTALQGSSSEAEHLEKRQGLLSTLLHLLTSSPLTRSTPSHLTPYTPGDLGIVPPPGKRNYQIHQNSLQTGKGAL